MGLPVGYLTDPAQLGRATLRHSLPAGAVLTADDLLPDFMVRQGEQVTLVAAVDGIEVRAAGLALQNGRQGALIRVQNADLLQGDSRGRRERSCRRCHTLKYSTLRPIPGSKDLVEILYAY